MSFPKEEFKVFLSHSEKDNSLTWRINDVLCRLHIRPFAYEYFYVGGTNRFERIKKMIKSTPYFVALLTKNGLESQWVNQEIGYAVGVNKRPIPIIEIDPITGDRLKSRGFVELNDPIIYNPKQEDIMIEELVYTFYGWLFEVRGWSDTIWLTCKCGKEFDGNLGYEPDYSVERLSWQCPNCNSTLYLSLPGFKLTTV